MTPPIVLSKEEREKFAEYLEQEAESASKIAEQMDKMGGPPVQMLAARLRGEAAASRLVMLKLRSVEVHTVEGSPNKGA